MKLSFEVLTEGGAVTSLVTEIRECIIAGWAGRDPVAIEHHIQELEAIGVPRPSAVPLYYRVAANQLIQADRAQVVGDGTSGEAEVFVFAHEGQTYVSLASDHTDRQLESHSVALSKQICVKPVAREAWVLEHVVDHWDSLVLRSWIQEGGAEVLYQEGDLAQLRTAMDLVRGHYGDGGLPDGCAMTCGTVTVRGGIRPSTQFTMALHDPVLDRTIRHAYALDVLPEIA